MQVITCNKPQFEYDINALVKSFYPEWDVRILSPESEVRDRSILEIAPVMEIVCGETEVKLTFHGGLHNSEEPKTKRDDSTENQIGLHKYEQPMTDPIDSPAYKNAFKAFLYTSLREETGMSLPWGNLTGIRPTKMAMTMLEQGESEEAIAAFLRETHFVSAKKTALGIDIAKREREILSALHYEDGYSLYVGIPFCPTTCLYCSFTSYPIRAWRKRVSAYLSALEREIDAVAALYRDKILDTVYIGGGTPSSLS
ncbi:MAG: coproporphyrinogen dehydrogenase HemZ, partial [bacterium]|nr:coproporphyrinogen dehydrogenase HemZ [bacterium]